ncbi:LysE family translocator [Desulfonatronovibrio hydrogenovorans]|uniref:LysE family translocator n=1 Tax=Desulfonatronovibrio hydrogenovorans TaxID=53245 RepID=UPI00048E600C|nr:LysE family translocator [Desulfonatronovibrio hydrogenovorans]
MFSVEFLITSLVVVMIPGTGVIYTVSNGLFCGRKASLAAAAGCTMGIVPHLLASVLGLSAILHMSAVAFQVMKYVGAAYLLYLAWTMWRESGALKFDSGQSNIGVWSIVRRGFLINILNPKLSIFFLAFLPLFVAPGSGSPIWQMTMLSIAFMCMTLVVFIVYGISADGFRKYVVNSPVVAKWMQRSFAACFAVLGIKLATADQ